MPASENAWAAETDPSYLGGRSWSAAGEVDYLVGQRAGQSDFTPRYFDEDGAPTPFAPTADNVADAFFRRVNRGSGERGDAWYTKTLVELAFDTLDSQYEPIGNVRQGVLFTNEGQEIPIENATAKDVWDTVSPEVKAIYELHGLSESDVLSQVDNDPIRLNHYHQEFVERTRHEEALNRYAQQHGAAYWVAGAGAFAANIITDPINIATLGVAGVAAGAGRAISTKAVQTAVNIAGRNNTANFVGTHVSRHMGRFVTRLKNGSPVEAVVEAITPIQREYAGRVLVGSLVAENVGLDLASQYAEHEVAVRYGLLEEDEHFKVDFGRVAVTGLLTMALGSVAARSMGLRGIDPTPREYMVHNRSSSVSQYLQSLVSRDVIGIDDQLDIRLVSDLEGMEQVLRQSFDVRTYEQLSGKLKASFGDDAEELSRLADFMSRRPNESELENYIATKPSKVPDTEYNKAANRVREREALLIEAERSGDSQVIRSAKKSYQSAVRQLDEARSKFQLQREIRNSPEVRAWAQRAATPEIRSANDPAPVRKDRAEFLSSRILSDPTRLAKRHVGNPRKFLRSITFFLPTNKVNNRLKTSDDFSRFALMLRALIDTNGLDGLAVKADGSPIQTIWSRMNSFRGDRASVLREFESILGSKAEFRNVSNEALGRQVLQSLALGRTVDNADVAKLGKELQKYFDAVGQRGVAARYLENLLDNFLPVQLIKDRVASKRTELNDLLSSRFEERYGVRRTTGDDYVVEDSAPVFRKTLAKVIREKDFDSLGISVDDDLSVFMLPDVALAGETESIRAGYVRLLREDLAIEAQDAITRRLGHTPKLRIDSDTYERVGKRVDTRETRKIEQDFWYSDEVMDLGVVETDINLLTRSYEESTGYNIVRQEALNDLFGEPVTWDDAMYALDKLAVKDGDKAIAEAVARTEQIASGRLGVKERSDLLEVFNSFTRSVTYGALPLMIVGTEGLAAAARAIGINNINLGTRAMKRALTGLSKEDLRRMGFALELEYDQSRAYGIAEDMRSDATANKVLGAMHKIEAGVRKYGGEMMVTRRLKVMHFAMSSGILDRYRNNLDKLTDLKTVDRGTVEGNKTFLANARKAGVRKDHAEIMLQNGVITPEHINAAKAFKELDKDILGDIFEMQNRIDELPEDIRVSGASLIDSLTRLGTADADAFVTTPSPNTVLRSDHAIANAFFMYTTFPLAFVQRTMERAFMAPGGKAMSYLGVYLFGEMFSSTLRRIVYGNESADQIFKEWEENPIEMASLVLARAPITGPFNMPAELFAQSLGARAPGFSIGGSAALGRTFRTGQAAINTVRGAVTGEDVSSDLNRLLTSLPGSSMLGAQALRVPMMHTPDEASRWDYTLQDRPPVPKPTLLQSTPPNRSFELDAQAQPLINTDFGVSDALDFLEPDTGDDPGSVDTLG